VDVQPTKRRQERGKRQIAHVLDVAARMFADVGYEATTTNAIAAAAGISPGSLYQFFANKEAIGEALVARYVDELEALYAVAFDPELAHRSLEELVDGIVDPLIAFSLANPAAHTLLYVSDVSPDVAQVTAALHASVLQQLETIISLRAPHLRRQQLARTARVSIQIFKAMQPLILDAASRQRAAFVRDLKTALIGYLTSIEAPRDPTPPATQPRTTRPPKSSPRNVTSN
jgi:AcrR family transcriptional regulator